MRSAPYAADPLEFLARVLVHIPDNGYVTTRYRGGYATPLRHAGEGGAGNGVMANRVVLDIAAPAAVV
ncbi:hypothetical protein [Gemmatimonas sp.]|jgi:hypothetical protein|uniref:hypothetical protein n=1 Tax=Gemmatimonas sp. TaxID=1962908 RepID=UPI0037C103BB